MFIVEPGKVIPMFFGKSTGIIRALIKPYCYRQHLEFVRMFFYKLLHCGKYLKAGAAPGFPEIDQYKFPSEISNIYFIAIQITEGCIGNNVLRFVRDRKSTRLNSSHVAISYAVFCL